MGHDGFNLRMAVAWYLCETFYPSREHAFNAELHSFLLSALHLNPSGIPRE